MTFDPGIPYGYLARRKVFHSYTDSRHLATIGPTRSGKGATVIVPALLLAQHSLIVVDPKGQNAAITARRRKELGDDVIVLNPFGMHTGGPWKLPRHRYNPLAHLDIESPNVVADVSALSQSLVLTQGRDPYFDDTARDFVTTINLHLLATCGKDATLPRMRRMVTDIAARGKAGAEHLVAMGKSPHAFVSQPIGRFRDVEARDISSAINSAVTQTSFLDSPAFSDPVHGALTGNDLDFLQLKRRPTTVFVIVPDKYLDTYARFIRLVITSALGQLCSEPGGHPTLFVLDEFARLENLVPVSTAFAYGAGFNVQLWPFLQDLPQLEAVYGKKAHSILANCGMLQFFGPSDVQTAQFLRERGGMFTGIMRGRSYSGLIRRPRGESRNETRMPLMQPEETMGLSPYQSIVFFGGMHQAHRAGRMPYWKIPRLIGMYDPDPYHAVS